MEIWKDVIGFERIYQVSSLGNIKRIDCANVHYVKPFKDKHGYFRVNLSKDGKAIQRGVHQIVCSSFLMKRENHNQVNHIDGDKENNNVKNLEWCDSIHNNRHAYRTGLNKGRKGEKNPSSKLKEKDVIVIKKKLKNKEMTQKEISSEYKVSASLISKINSGGIWSHIK